MRSFKQRHRDAVALTSDLQNRAPGLRPRSATTRAPRGSPGPAAPGRQLPFPGFRCFHALMPLTLLGFYAICLVYAEALNRRVPSRYHHGTSHCIHGGAVTTR